MRFTLKQLEYFLATVKAKTVAKAAESARISPASVSTAIMALEAEFDVKLFVRQHSKGMMLTAVGEQFAARAQKILDTSNGFYNDAYEANSLLRGSITVGCLVTLAPLILPQLCHQFTSENPEIEIVFFEGNQDQLIGGIRHEEIDIALTYLMHLPQDVDFVELVTLPPYVLLAANHPLAKRETLTVEDIAAEPFIVLDLPHSRDYYLSFFRDAGLQPNIAARSTQPEVIRTMVANGYGISISVARPKNKSAGDGKATVTVPFSGDIKKLPLGLISLNGSVQNQVSLAFESHARSVISENYVPGVDFTDHKQT